MTDDLGVVGHVAQLLGQLPGRLADLQHELLYRALDVHLPALVAEMPLDLARDARLGVGGQAAADSGIEVVDRLQQADVPHLHQVLGRLGAALVPLHAGPHQVAVTADQQLAGRRPAAAGPRQGLDDAQELAVIEPGQVAGHPARHGRRGEPIERALIDGYFLHRKCFHEERLSRFGRRGKPGSQIGNGAAIGRPLA